MQELPNNEERFRESLETFFPMDDMVCVARCLWGIAATTLGGHGKSGRRRTTLTEPKAVVLGAAAMQLTMTLGTSRSPEQMSRIEVEVVTLLDDRRFRRQREKGEALSVKEAVVLALGGGPEPAASTPDRRRILRDLSLSEEHLRMAESLADGMNLVQIGNQFGMSAAAAGQRMTVLRRALGLSPGARAPLIVQELERRGLRFSSGG